MVWNGAIERVSWVLSLAAWYLSSFDNLVAYGITYEFHSGVELEFSQYVGAMSVYCFSSDAKS